MKNRVSNCLFIKSLKETFSVSKFMFLSTYTIALVQGLLTAIPIILMQQLFDEVTNFSSGNVSMVTVVYIVGLLFCVKVAIQILMSVGDYLYEYHHMLVIYGLRLKLHNKLAKVRPIQFEDKLFLESIEKGYEGAVHVRKLVDSILMIILYYLPTIIVLSIYLYKSNPFLPFLLVLIFIPVVLRQFIDAKLYGELEDTLAPLHRKLSTYSEYITGNTAYKETRSLGAYQYFIDKIKYCLNEKNDAQWKLSSTVLKRDLITKLISLLGYIVVLIFLYLLIKEGDISIGYFAAIFTALNNLVTMMEVVAWQIIGDSTEISSKIKNFFKLIDICDYKDLGTQSSQDNLINLKNVSFVYPNTTKNALDDISISLETNQTIAIVGENGSGKTTLLKILMGIYPPTTGTIDNTGLENTSAVFQSFGKYHLSLAENVHISDYLSNGDVLLALNKANFILDSKTYPEGIDTMLSREFGGVDLSGGQWQKIAISRGFYKESNRIFLDEPTSAIDPLEEAHIYSKFEELIKNKSAFIVTHRMGAVKMADTIIVMHQGKILDYGSHNTLLSRCDKYKEMWLSQSTQYIESN